MKLLPCFSLACKAVIRRLDDQRVIYFPQVHSQWRLWLWGTLLGPFRPYLACWRANDGRLLLIFSRPLLLLSRCLPSLRCLCLMDSVEIKIRVISCLRCFSFDLLWFYFCTLECGPPTVQTDVPGSYWDAAWSTQTSDTLFWDGCDLLYPRCRKKSKWG